MTPFAFLSATRLRFGRGVASEAVDAVRALGMRPLVIHGRDGARASWLVDALRSGGFAVAALPCPGEPDLALLTRALGTARDFGPDVVVGLGGGAAMDLAKALAALLPAPGTPLDHLEVVGAGLPMTHAFLPFVAIPTTAGTGSEVTRNAVIGLPDHGRKVSLRDERMLARVALVDPALTDGTSAMVTLASGLDAVVQVIEPLISCRSNPLTDALCRAAIPEGLRALARLTEAPDDRDARDAMAFVSVIGGLALSNAGLGAVHGLAGVIGGRTDAPHGALCGALLGPVLVANGRAVQPGSQGHARLTEVAAMIQAAWGIGPDGVAHWASARGLPSLAAMGVKAVDAPDIAAAAQASSSMKGNPVPLTDAVLETILRDALA